MIDIHSHVLWAVDDGPPTREQAVAMLEAAARAGTTHLVATPHWNSQFQFHAGTSRRKLAELRYLPGAMPYLFGGCELHLTFENVQAALAEPEQFTLARSRYLLLEYPEQTVPAGHIHAVSALLSRGIVPVIAHPERHHIFRKAGGPLEELLKLGCLAQVTAGSLTGHFGRDAEAAAWRFLEQGRTQFIASDAHDLGARSPDLAPARFLVARRFGEPAAQRIFRDNPLALIENRPVESRPTEDAASRPGLPAPDKRLPKELLRD